MGLPCYLPNSDAAGGTPLKRSLGGKLLGKSNGQVVNLLAKPARGAFSQLRKQRQIEHDERPQRNGKIPGKAMGSLETQETKAAERALPIVT